LVTSNEVQDKEELCQKFIPQMLKGKGPCWNCYNEGSNRNKSWQSADDEPVWTWKPRDFPSYLALVTHPLFLMLLDLLFSSSSHKCL
jgi:hypothetical protein